MSFSEVSILLAESRSMGVERDRKRQKLCSERYHAYHVLDEEERDGMHSAR
jgi:hypothetical protein